jgi:site-specific recombinase XerD
VFFDGHVVMGFLDWLEHERGCAATTRNQRLMALRAFFSYAGFLDCVHLATSLALAAIPAKKTPTTIADPLSEAALKALLQQPDTTTIAGRRNQVFDPTGWKTVRWESSTNALRTSQGCRCG